MNAIDHEMAHEMLRNSLDERLNVPEQVMLDEHVQVCPTCFEYAHQLRVVDEGLRRAFPGMDRLPLTDIDTGKLISGWKRRKTRERFFRYAGGFAGLAAAVLVFFFVVSEMQQFAAGNPPPSTQIPGIVLPTSTTQAAEVALPVDLDGKLLLTGWTSLDNQDIFTMDPDGDHLVNLTDDPARDSFPAWSPDGKQIAFISNRSGHSEIYVMEADGRRLTRLTFTSEDAPQWTGPLAWSPDGAWIAAVRARLALPEQPASISYPEELSMGPLYRVGVDGSGAQLLTKADALAWSPQWTLDGTRIFYNSVQAGKHFSHLNVRIFSMKADGSDARAWGAPLTGYQEGRFAISPDGKEIAYFSISRVRHSLYPDRLMVANLDGSDPRVLVELQQIRFETGGGSSEYFLSYPNQSLISWSPDGTDYLVQVNDPSINQLTKIVQLNDRSRIIIISAIGAGSAWALDGRYYGYIDGQAIRIVDSQSPRLTQTTILDSSRGSPTPVEVYWKP